MRGLENRVSCNRVELHLTLSKILHVHVILVHRRAIDRGTHTGNKINKKLVLHFAGRFDDEQAFSKKSIFEPS
jgi:hypothetical protein